MRTGHLAGSEGVRQPNFTIIAAGRSIKLIASGRPHPRVPSLSSLFTMIKQTNWPRPNWFASVSGSDHQIDAASDRASTLPKPFSNDLGAAVITNVPIRLASSHLVFDPTSPNNTD